MTIDTRSGSIIHVTFRKDRPPMPCRILFKGICRSCSAKTIMVRTAMGKAMPVDVPVDGEPIISHFSTCPQSKEWRKP